MTPKKWIVNNEGLKIMNNQFFNELKKKIMNSEWSDFLPSFLLLMNN